MGTLLFLLNAFACRTSDTKDDTIDNDWDGYESSEDCHDNDPTMPEFDQDCDWISSYLDCDDQDETSTSVLTDEDRDGVSTDEDCDDTDPNVSNTTEYSFTENFNQGTNKTDIVIAVDTSCSMDDDIYNLKATFF